MTFAIEFRHEPYPAKVLEHWVELGEPVAAAAPGKLAKAKALEVVDQDLVWLRERLATAYLAPRDYGDDEAPERKFVGAYDTSNTRDAFPRALAKELAECSAEVGEAGRLPIDYVIALARSTTRVTGTATRAKRTSSIPLRPQAFEDAALVRLVTALAPEHRHWLRYAYGDSRAWEDESGVTVALWELVAPQFGKLQAKTLKRLQGLAHLAAQHGQRRANADADLYKAARLAALLGVSEANYDQHWRPRWQILLAGIERIDREALTALCKALNKARPRAKGKA